MQVESYAVMTKKWDLIGIGLSVLCAIHCVGMPVLIGVLPLLGLDFMANHEFELVMMSQVFTVAGLTYFNGYRHHHRKEVFVFFAVGLVLFLGVRPFLSEALHPYGTIAGGLAFVLGHWKNWHWHRPSCEKECCAGESAAG